MIKNRHQTEVENPLQAMHQPISKTLSILVAEDEPTNQKFLQNLLERAGHSVTLASDGCQAYMLWEQGAFDLILMDIQMPGMRGDEVVRKIRQQEQGRRIPIIAVTAHTFMESRKSLLEAGCDGYVAKPFQFKELIAEIKQVL